MNLNINDSNQININVMDENVINYDLTDMTQTNMDVITTDNVDMSFGDSDNVDFEMGARASGTTNYNLLINKPKINEVTLEGNKNSNQLHLQDEMDYLTNAEIELLLDNFV